MNAFVIVLTLVVLVAMIVQAIRVLRYSMSDDWKIEQRLSRYAGRYSRQPITGDNDGLHRRVGT